MFACKCKFLNECCVFVNACMLMEVNKEDELFTSLCVKINAVSSATLPPLFSILIAVSLNGMLFRIMHFQSIYAFNERDCKSIICLYYPASLSLALSLFCHYTFPFLMVSFLSAVFSWMPVPEWYANVYWCVWN